jgi:hypothetical protein
MLLYSKNDKNLEFKDKIRKIVILHWSINEEKKLGDTKLEQFRCYFIQIIEKTWKYID